jgi:hypothetical protein
MIETRRNNLGSPQDLEDSHIEGFSIATSILELRACLLQVREAERFCAEEVPMSRAFRVPP